MLTVTEVINVWISMEGFICLGMSSFLSMNFHFRSQQWFTLKSIDDSSWALAPLHVFVQSSNVVLNDTLVGEVLDVIGTSIEEVVVIPIHEMDDSNESATDADT